MASQRCCYDHPRPMVTVDCVVLRVKAGRLEVLLVRRKREPEKGCWALPGGCVQMKEPLEAAVLRELKEETGLSEISCLLQNGAYGDPKRDPRGRVVSVAYLATLAGDGRVPKAGSDADAAEWHPVDLPPDGMAFDHPTIIGDALRRLAVGGRTGGILFSFLPMQFTTEQLAVVLKAVFGTKIDPMTYLKPFIDGQLVKPSKDKTKNRFVGWHSGKCR